MKYYLIFSIFQFYHNIIQRTAFGKISGNKTRTRKKNKTNFIQKDPTPENKDQASKTNKYVTACKL